MSKRLMFKRSPNMVFYFLSGFLLLKWNFRNEPTNNFSEIPAFSPKSGWKPPKGHASLEVSLSRVEKELLSNGMNDSIQSNLSGDEWKALRNLADDRSNVIKGADKGSSKVIWERADYLQEASKQLRDTNIYEGVKFNENILTGLVERSNKIFSRLCSHKLISEKELKYFTCGFKKATNLGKLYFLPKIHKGLSSVPGRPVISNCGTPKIFSRLCSRKLISEKELKYFTYSFKKATNLGKLYFLPKIHKGLSSVPGRPVISNCGTPTEKISEYLDHILKPVMQESWSYIKILGIF